MIASLALDQKLKVSILNWLSPLQMSDVHQNTSNKVEKGSGKWFVASEKFLDWRTKDHSRLWCWGIREYAQFTIMPPLTMQQLAQAKPYLRKLLYSRQNVIPC
jgi:hypothetical protein